VGDPGSVPDVVCREQCEEKKRNMSLMLTLALDCDLTRGYLVQFSTCGSGRIFWPVGATNGQHVISHTEASPQPTIHASVVLTMEMLAEFLTRLRDTPEGGGSLLDRCSILCTSELSDGRIHSNTEYPLLIAGRGNGRLRGGIHYRSTTRENTSKAVLTALQGAGVPLDSWGVAEGQTTQIISDLMT